MRLQMSGRRIDDHGSWMGKGSKASVFAEGVKSKEIPASMGAGEMMNYPDTEDLIHRDQEKSVKKIHGRSMKDGERN